MSIDNSTFNWGNKDEFSLRNEKKPISRIPEETEDGRTENSNINFNLDKVFECLAFIYDKQRKMEENQKKMEEKLDRILDIVNKKQMK